MADPPVPIFQSFLVDREEFNTWSHAFGGPNTPWNSGIRLIAGNFFAGLQGSVSVIMPTPTIEPGSTIISADLVLTTEEAGNGGFTTVTINTCTRGEEPFWSDAPMETMFGFEGWRRGVWSAGECDLRNSTNQLLTQSPDPVVLPNRILALRFEDSATPEPFPDKAMRARMANRVVGYPTPGGGDTLTAGFVVLSKTGAPATTGVFVDIYDSNPATGGNAIPGNILATSDEIPIATIGLQNQYPLVFSGVNQIPISAGVQYFMVIRPSQPYTPNGLDYVREHHHNAFLGQNRLRHFGVGMGVDWQNYPGAADVEGMRNTRAFVPVPDVSWDPPVLPVPGQLNVTPDLTDLLQYQVDLAVYDNGGPDRRAVYFSIQGGGGGPNRIFSSFRSLRAPPILRVTWLPPAPDDDKLADPTSRFGRHRIHEPWTDEYYRFKYGKDKPKPDELVAEIERPNVLADMLDQAVLDDYDARNAQNERDIAELEAYISASTDALGQDVDTAMLALGTQEELIAQLEANVVLARETLIIALESRRKHQNLLAAIEAVIRNYY
jgi:hypothetical protein